MGRPKGTPNRRSAEAMETLRKLKCDPLEGLVKIAQDAKSSAKLKAWCYAELCSYVYAKRKAVEVSPGEGVDTGVPVVVRFVPATPPAPPA